MNKFISETRTLTQRALLSLALVIVLVSACIFASSQLVLVNAGPQPEQNNWLSEYQPDGAGDDQPFSGICSKTEQLVRIHTQGECENLFVFSVGSVLILAAVTSILVFYARALFYPKPTSRRLHLRLCVFLE
ncbi:hypothetical protein [Photobacterium sanctipauli]|nr:hypothetical protein [Photobacterium sanctipauli]